MKIDNDYLRQLLSDPKEATELSHSELVALDEFKAAEQKANEAAARRDQIAAEIGKLEHESRSLEMQITRLGGEARGYATMLMKLRPRDKIASELEETKP